jgi:type IV pilus assembly protein PilY1
MVLGEPVITKLNNGTPVVIFGNGVNSDNSQAVLFVVNLSTGVYKAIPAPIGPNANPNGLFAPTAVDIDGNGGVDYVYAGDLQGNVWKYNLTNLDLAPNGAGGAAQRLFAAGVGQPITTKLAVAREPGSNRIWVFAGTGKLLELADLSTTTVQSMYGLIDSGGGEIKIGDLQKRNIAAVDSATGYRAFDPAAALPGDRRGWYVDWGSPQPGERATNAPHFDGPVLLIDTVIPTANTVCGAGGSGYRNALDPFTGTALRSPYFDANGDGKIGGNNMIGSVPSTTGQPTLSLVLSSADGSLLLGSGTEAAIEGIKVYPPPNAARRTSWRELIGN